MARFRRHAPSSGRKSAADADFTPENLKRRAGEIGRNTAALVEITDVVGLYMNPPDRALILCVDEKNQIHALDRTQPGLPLKRGHAATMTHDFKRHGTTTLFAALDMASGLVIGDVKPRHRAKEFLSFLRKIDRAVKTHLDVHLVADNYVAHKTPEVKAWLAKHKRFHCHFTPTSASWFNLGERVFAEITTKRIRRGILTSLADLEEAVRVNKVRRGHPRARASRPRSARPHPGRASTVRVGALDRNIALRVLTCREHTKDNMGRVGITEKWISALLKYITIWLEDPWTGLMHSKQSRGMEFEMPLDCLGLNIGGGGIVLGAEMAGLDIAAVGMCHWHEYERIQKILPDMDLLGTTIDSCHADLVVLGLNSGPMCEQRIKDQRADALEQIIHKARPLAILIAAEPAAFAIDDRFRARSLRALRRLGFRLMTREYAACELGLAISREVRFFVAMRPDLSASFTWPEASVAGPATVGSILADLMAERNWAGIAEWKRIADRPAPPLMLRAPRHAMANSADGKLSDAWSSIGIDGSGIADAAPSADIVGLPRLTPRMLMQLYTYPSSYEPPETKTALLRLLSSDSPPAMVAAVAGQIRQVIEEGVEMNEMPADQANSTSSAPPGTAT